MMWKYKGILACGDIETLEKLAFTELSWMMRQEENRERGESGESLCRFKLVVYLRGSSLLISVSE